ncbi:hypothetical protein [Bradyrhizobium sp. USDA 4452]
MSFIGGPVVKGLIDAYNLHLKATTTDKQTAANLAGQEIAAQTAETQSITQLKIAQIGHPYEPEKLAFYVWLTYFAKCVIWDTVLGLGTTPELKGTVGIWCGLIVSFYFVKRGAENVSKIITAIRK